MIPIVAVIVIVAAAVFLFLHASRAPSATMGTIVSPQVGVATSTITASTTEYTISAEYPQFGIPSIDTKIKTLVQNAANTLAAQADQDKPAENQFPLYSFTSDFDDVYIGPDYVSARLVLSEYTGGAHDMPLILGATFDRQTGATTTLEQALALTGMTLDQVASSSKAQLAQNPDTVPTGIWASGSDPTPDNYQNFLINKNSVIFIFQPYQVAPYAAGAPQISIPRIK